MKVCKGRLKKVESTSTNEILLMPADIGKVQQIAASKFFSAMTMANGTTFILAGLWSQTFYRGNL